MGGVSQTKCVYELLKRATSDTYHDYYHLLVGVEFPLKTQNYIHSFFEEHFGKEFIGFDDSKNYSFRFKYFRPWGQYLRSNNIFQSILYRVDVKLLDLQEKLGINRLKYDESYYKKGYANFSITQSLANYLVSNFKKIKKSCRYTLCTDEMAFHTLVWNSKYRNNIFDIKNEYESCMRLTTWVDRKNQFHKNDLPMLLKTNKLFARKFDTEDAVDIIYEIIKNRQ